jgi:hypothetical protein
MYFELSSSSPFWWNSVTLNIDLFPHLRLQISLETLVTYLNRSVTWAYKKIWCTKSTLNIQSLRNTWERQIEEAAQEANETKVAQEHLEDFIALTVSQQFSTLKDYCTLKQYEFIWLACE